jgi:excisionase family DNA binding protein
VDDKRSERGERVVSSGSPYPDVMTVEEAARYLGISKLSMYKLIRATGSTVPVKRVAGAFKVSRRQLLDWFESL